jgi:hypothetical protein
LIELIVREDTSQQATDLWQASADSTINTMNGISRVNDPFVGVIKISDQPVVKESYRNLPVFVLVGAGSGLVLFLSYLVLISYLEPFKRK